MPTAVSTAASPFFGWMLTRKGKQQQQQVTPRSLSLSLSFHLSFLEKHTRRDRDTEEELTFQCRYIMRRQDIFFLTIFPLICKFDTIFVHPLQSCFLVMSPLHAALLVPQSGSKPAILSPLLSLSLSLSPLPSLLR